MNRSIPLITLAALLALPGGAGSSTANIESLANASALKFAGLRFPASQLRNFSRAGAPNQARRPAIGTITGGINNSPAELRFDRRAWTLTGAANHSRIDIKIDHENKTITGGANNSPVDLRFAWSPETVIISGSANHSPVELRVDLVAGSVIGHSTHSHVRLEYDAAAGTIRGYAKHSPVELKFDRASGRLTGGMNNSQVDLTLVNLDIGTFLQYVFVFLN